MKAKQRGLMKNRMIYQEVNKIVSRDNYFEEKRKNTTCLSVNMNELEIFIKDPYQNKTNLPPLHQLVLEGSKKAIEDYLSGYPQAISTCCDTLKATPLIYAIATGKLALVTLLLEKGASLKATDKFGNTPLMFACLAKHLSIAKKIYASYANNRERAAALKEKNGSDAKAIHMAAILGDLDIFNWLIEEGEKLHLNQLFDMAFWTEPPQISAFLTPLAFAVGYGQLNLVEDALKRRPVLITQVLNNKSQSSLIQWAACQNRFEMLKFLYEKDPLAFTKKDKRQQNILNYATESRNMEIIKWVVDLMKEKKLELWSDNPKIFHPIFKAIGYNDWALTSYFLEQGATLQDKYDGKTLFIYALATKSLDIAEQLYKMNPKVLDDGFGPVRVYRNQCIDHISPLAYTAIYNKHEAMAWLLAKKEVSIDNDYYLGITEIGIALRKEAYECCELLYNRGANLNSEFKNSSLLLVGFSDLKLSGMIKWLMEHGAGIGQAYRYHGGDANYFTSNAFRKNQQFFRSGTANQLLIGFTINGESIANKPGFEEAIDSIDKLRVALADNKKKIPLLENIDNLIDACEKALNRLSDARMLEEITEVRDCLIEEKKLKNLDELNELKLKKLREDYSEIIEPKKKSSKEKKGEEKNTLALSKPNKRNENKNKNRNKKKSRRAKTQPLINSESEDFNRQLAGLQHLIVDYKQALASYLADLNLLEMDSDLQAMVVLAKDAVAKGDNAAVSHARAIMHRFNSINKIQQSIRDLSLELDCLYENISAVGCQEGAARDLQPASETLHIIHSRIVECRQSGETVKLEQFETDLKNLHQSLGLDAPQKTKTRKPPKTIRAYDQTPYEKYIRLGPEEPEAKLPSPTSMAGMIVDNPPQNADYALTEKEKEPVENKLCKLSFFPKPLSSLEISSEDFDSKLTVFGLFSAINSNNDIIVIATQQAEYEFNLLESLEFKATKEKTGEGEQGIEAENASSNPARSFGFHLLQFSVAVHKLCPGDKAIKSFKKNLAQFLDALEDEIILNFAKYFQNTIMLVKEEKKYNQLQSPREQYVYIMKALLSCDCILWPELTNMKNQQQSKYGL